jgi:hypothetical protein
MNFMDALQYPMQDKNWLTKLFIGAVVLLVPIIGGMVVLGYGLRLIQMIYRREPGLPEWDDWGGDLTRGFMALLGILIYFIPSILIYCCTSVLGTSDNSAIVLFNCLLYLINLAYSIVVTPIAFSAIARYAATEDFKVFTDVAGRIQDVTSRLGDVLTLYLNLLIFGIVAYIIVFIGLILCCIPGLLALAGATLAQYYIIAQWGIQIGAAGNTQFMGPPPQQGGYSFQ